MPWHGLHGSSGSCCAGYQQVAWLHRLAPLYKRIALCSNCCREVDHLKHSLVQCSRHARAWLTRQLMAVDVQATSRWCGWTGRCPCTSASPCTASRTARWSPACATA